MASTLEKISRIYLFPVILFLFPFVNVNVGIDLADTGYSLANYVFFASSESSFLLNTYLSNVIGYFLTILPFGQTMLGIKIYATLSVCFMALLGYRFFITKMPAWIAFISQMVAIGLCWCPTVILYHYLTYFFFLLGAILLFRGLAGGYSYCLVLAGICLGINIFIRTPNILHAALILCVWYYGFIRNKKFAQITRETLLCLAGYIGAVLFMLIILMSQFGLRAPIDMIIGLFDMSASNDAYTFGGMLVLILESYFDGAKWLLYMIICVMPGIPFLMIRFGGVFRNKISEERIILCKKIIYCTAIVFLFYILGRMGMHNLKYYQKEAVASWAMVFLLLSLINMVWMLFSKSVDVQWKLIASIGIIIILITPLGSANRAWTIINSLFFVAPVTFWRVYHFGRYGRRYIGNEYNMIPLYPLKAMQLAIIIAFTVQSLGVGSVYVFRDCERGSVRNTGIERNDILKGMRTNKENATNIQELNDFIIGYPDLNKNSKVILFGDIPALSYYLNRPSALSNAWPDLDTFSTTQFVKELDSLDDRPLIIINAYLAERLLYSEKKQYLDTFIDENNYTEVFRNAQFVVYL